MDPALDQTELTDIHKRLIQASKELRELVGGKQKLEAGAEEDDGSTRAMLQEFVMLCMLTMRVMSTLTAVEPVASSEKELIAMQAELAFKEGSFPAGTPLDEQWSLTAFRECDLTVFMFVDVLGELIGEKGKATWWIVDCPKIGKKIWVKNKKTTEQKMYSHSVIRVDIGGRSYILDPTGCQMGWWELVSDLEGYVARHSQNGEDLIPANVIEEQKQYPAGCFGIEMRAVIREAFMDYQVDETVLIDKLVALSPDDRAAEYTKLWLHVAARLQWRDNGLRRWTIGTPRLGVKLGSVHGAAIHKLHSHPLQAFQQQHLAHRITTLPKPTSSCTHDVPLPPSPSPPHPPPLHRLSTLFPSLSSLPSTPAPPDMAKTETSGDAERTKAFAEALKGLEQLDIEPKVPNLDPKDYNTVRMTAESVIRLCKDVVRRVSFANVEDIINDEPAGNILGVARDAKVAFTGGSFPPGTPEEQKMALVAYRQCDLSVSLCVELLQEILGGEVLVDWCTFTPQEKKIKKIWISDKDFPDYHIFRHSVIMFRGGKLCMIADPTYEQLGCTVSVLPEVDFENAHECYLNAADKETEMQIFSGFWAEVREVMARGVVECYGEKKMFRKMKKMAPEERHAMQKALTENVGAAVVALKDAWAPTLEKWGRKGLRGERV
ncbi:uncharacterized protein BDZ99DRAFT_479928 [Mytilinidion resinicola]|uniref:Uncharacterized protein n=1 Tax=Mytilinidion resinicola TaxID=574789 RepID=A0A6A6YCT3_9PEZI|nr:uncharacterized protein BDZ99DRAFT_479928 [Mytilinidion resinicola]KAF2805905.1 hypothetical protein BDZ99DRAFT_479928 [Mytilinidion resinicola]